MALYHKWDVKNDFLYVLQFFSLISDGLGSVLSFCHNSGVDLTGYVFESLWNILTRFYFDHPMSSTFILSCGGL
jgi:hypothetical protein